MKVLLKIISYLFHPLFIPVAGTVAYFKITPKYSPLAVQSGNVLPIFILTIIIPIIFSLILSNIGIMKSFSLPSTKEQRFPLYLIILLFLMILYKVIPNNYTIELFYFFVGLTSAAITTLMLLFLNFKSSLHMTGIASLFMYLVCLSVHFEVNITIALSITMLAIGLLATSRLYTKAHSATEIIVGLCVGLFSQLLTIKFWI